MTRIRFGTPVILAVAALFIARAVGMNTWDAIGVEFAVYVLVTIVAEVIRYRRFKRWVRER